MASIRNSRILRTIPLLIAVCIVSLAAQAAGGVSTYIFLSDQSTVVQTGGIAGVHRTYVIEGQFQLSIDPIAPNAGVALFTHVDANATDDSPYRRTLDPNEVFNMTGLVGTVIGNTIIVFLGKAADSSDILIIAILNNDLVYLVGQTFPPPNSADFFIFSLDAVAQRKYGGGNGSADDPYQIATAADLNALGETPEDYDKHFILTADIDLDPNLPSRKVFNKAVIAPDTNDVKRWFQGTPFTGVFDGNGHTVSHLTIVGSSYLGLFGSLQGQVKDLGVVDVNITGLGDYVGSLVGYNIIGSITTCHSTGSVSGTSSVGGLVGSNGGGLFSSGSIINCYSTCTVNGTGVYVGGLVGRNGVNWELPGGVLTNCYSTGTVSGGSSVGGLVGFNGDGSITNCYSTGAVSGNSFVGGFVGSNESHITTSYSTGTVIGTGSSVGGLVGGNWYGSITSSFWDIQTSGQTTSAGGTGKTTAEMQTASTFLDAGWDFVDETENGSEDIWWILEGQDYPRLWWELIEILIPKP